MASAQLAVAARPTKALAMATWPRALAGLMHLSLNVIEPHQRSLTIGKLHRLFAVSVFPLFRPAMQNDDRSHKLGISHDGTASNTHRPVRPAFALSESLLERMRATLAKQILLKDN